MSSRDAAHLTESAAPLAAIIIGAGFAGIGMAIALQRAGIHDFAIVERSHDVGGVWRDNSYPGAACDVPSHLYSFSFEPNPAWSRVFAPQPEIHAYLQHCARKYGLARYLRFGADVAHARYDEAAALWRVTLADGTTLSAAVLVSGTGQLSRPAMPDLPGIDTFRGRAFHSAHWDHDYALAGKRVAVVGTGASAIQFVPAIAGDVQRLTVFQRSPAYVMPRPDRAYRPWEKALFRTLPWAMKLHRASIYMRYESRAIAFTRLHRLMKVAVGRPFRKLLARDVPDAALRARLTPDYPIGCKRILLSSDYLAAMSRDNVELVTQRIRRVTERGIETVDGVHHPVDAIVYGTGFAATEFLSPMRITGRDGLDLNDAWRRGAQAYLGLTVPGFPNFFMLYGPNTNLGHNSIVYMLESQIAHVMRCLHAMRRNGAREIDVDARRYRRFNAHVQQRLEGSVWNSCKSWYVDASGHNSTNWPGFTLTYRWITRFTGMSAYRFTHSVPESVAPTRDVVVAPPAGPLEALTAASLRGFLRVAFRPLIGPPFGARMQRRVVALLSPLMPGTGGTLRYRTHAHRVPVEVVAPKRGDTGGAILYLHGGAFCLGGPHTHRGVTTRLANDAGLPVWVPDYRLAPEHPGPAALDDALAVYDAMRAQGHAPHRIAIAGDSAGGALALALAIALRERGEPAAAALLLISPVTDPALGGATLASRRHDDPMIRRGWLEQGLRWYHGAGSAAARGPLDTDLRGLPPMLVQAGDQEVLLSDAQRLASHAQACGVPCRLEIHAARWHVFHLQSFYLRSARDALRTLAEFASARVAATA
ncbi:flavin-containing monooxygenase [Burkholderia cepacia]|uniref:Alpha/beta hydrolase n=3 Tax=Burkholderia cepacia TaxID=292 RepID=A0ABN5D9Q7_BURCE|nr:alpha/beta hydrolase fold domain-containing protein [Burkholderia cepacia]AIO29012.1 pyridine nucleotide-disulfide oxidoreductase family protein [Burkholderia cepacia ATCC 25416]ALK20393.1 alpha/beta hydrolase [Burkholderia cepacia ATCC 25416]ASE96862.1 steryl acetyl hydrolase [Burkholderia cepacia]ATF82187.1 alpha/beta hydrolase [Burkholderia cepacia]MCA8468516.1 alpha/beta hydrolase fold domain-containing protein [Burkholderia cepacia]